MKIHAAFTQKRKRCPQAVRPVSLAATFGFNFNPNAPMDSFSASAGLSGSGVLGPPPTQPPPSLATHVSSLNRTNDSFSELLSVTEKFPDEWRGMFEDWSGPDGGQSESAAAALAVADADTSAPPVLRAVASGNACPPRLLRSVSSYIREVNGAGLKPQIMLDRQSKLPSSLKPAAGLVKQAPPTQPPLVPTPSGGLKRSAGLAGIGMGIGGFTGLPKLKPATGGLKRSAGLADIGDYVGLPKQLKPAAGFAPPSESPGLSKQPSPTRPLVPTPSGGLKPATGRLKRSAGLAGIGMGIGDVDGLPKQLKPAAGFAPPSGSPGLSKQPSLTRLRSS